MSTPISSNHYLFPASFAQRRIWFVQETITDPSVYHVPLLYKLDGPVDLEILQRSINKLVERHESFRTYFTVENNDIMQVIIPELDYVISHIQLPTEAVMQINDRIMQDIRSPFSLEHAPLFRMVLYSISEQEHYLLINMHHIITDGWSYSVFMRELSLLYSAVLQGKEAELTELPIQVADFSQWQRDSLQGEGLEKQMLFWEKHLEGELPVLDLPVDPAKPLVIDNTGASLEFHIPLQLSERFAQLCSSSGTSLYIGLLAVYQLLLARYSGQDNIIIGTPIANRHHIELENVIGMFVNTMTLRARLHDNPTFREMLMQLRKTALEAYEHQDVPFDMLVERLAPERSLGQTPIFQAMFSFQNHPKLELDFPHIDIKPVELDLGTAKFELYLDIAESPDGLHGIFEYQKNLYDEVLIEQLSVHYVQLIESILEDTEQQIWHIPFMYEQEKRSITEQLYQKKDAKIQVQSSTCGHHSFEQWAALQADTIAVRYQGDAMTYAELNQRANQVAWYMRENGVVPGTAVGLWLDPSIDLVVGMLGVWKAGCCCVALNSEHPVARNILMLQHAGVSCIVTNENNVRKVPQAGQEIFCLERIPAIPAYAANPEVQVAANDGAYLFWNTGASGASQTVAAPHYRIVQLSKSAAETFDLDRNDVWAMLHAVDSELALWEICGALFNGGTLVIVPGWIAEQPKYMNELLIQEKITRLTLTQASFLTWIRLDETSAKGKLELRTIFIKGKNVTIPSMNGWLGRHTRHQPKLIQINSLSELGGVVSSRIIPASGNSYERPDRGIGAPLTGRVLYILDASGEVVPMGAAGTLHASEPDSDHARAFHASHPDERWSYRSVNGEPGVWLYRMDDICRYLPNGEIECLRHVGYQAELGEYIVQLDEIRMACLHHPAVQEAAIQVRRDEYGIEYVMAYLVAVTGQTVPVQQIQHDLRDKLPEYMIPGTLLWVEQLPRLTSGEIDYDLLQSNTEHKSRRSAYVPPANPIEESLVNIWETVLEVTRIGVEDNYFVCGGDSIRMLSIIALAKDVNLYFGIRDLLSHQTIRELAPHVLMNQDIVKLTDNRFDLVPEEDLAKLPEDIEDAYPLTQLQRGMLFQSELHSGSRLYHDLIQFSIKGSFDKKVWDEAFQMLINRHPILRTTFDLSSYSLPLQLVHTRGKLPIKYVDVSDTDPDTQQEMLQKWVEHEMDTSFDWSQSLLRVVLLQRAKDWVQLIVSMHHSVLDGWSVAHFTAELFGTVDHLLQDQVLEPAPRLQTTFKQYVREELNALQSPEHKEYWERRLDGFSRIRLPQWEPTDTAPPVMKLKEVDISRSLSRDVQELAQRTLIPIKSWLLAVHIHILKTLTNQRDITTGVLFHGRLEQKDGDRALGLFLNTLPFRMQLDGGTWAALAEKTWETEKEMLQYRRYPMAQIQQDTGSGKLFETFFNFTHFYVSEQKLGSYGKLHIVEEPGYADNSFPFGAEFSLDGESGELRLALRWDQVLFSEEQMSRVAGYYQMALRAIVHHTYEVADHDTLLSVEELQEIDNWNQTENHFPQVHLLHKLFEQQVESTPEQLALVYQGQRLSYRECNEQANRLAHYLHKHGVGPDVKAGICLERSTQLVTSLMAILKAGGAYVPIHPHHPAVFVQELIQDADLGLVVTSEKWAPLFEGYAGTVLYMERIHEELATESASNPNVPCLPEQLAYMIYTSGSTGKPKGVLIEHKAIANRLLWMQKEYRLTGMDRVLQKTPFTFDVSVWEFFWPLITGAGLVIAEPEGHKDPEYLIKLIQEEEITTIHFVPSMLHAFLAQRGVEQCTTLKRVICSGEALTHMLKQLFFEKLSCELHNLYGPTEAAVDVTSWSCKPEDINVPIGYPIANVYLRVLNKRMLPVPVGVPGELYIGGVCLARGYHHRPELDAERFILDPLRAELNARLYKTGDEARYLPNGAIEYMGRLDHQVKIRGHRIEMGEIEARLGEHPAIAECVVYTTSDNRQHVQLVACIVQRNPNVPLDRKDLYSFSKNRMPEYMIPGHWMFIDKMPLTTSGKIDRKALPQPDTSPVAELDDAFQPPRNSCEHQLSDIWKQVLQVAAPGIRDSFFHLGGNSLLAIQLMARVEQAFDRKLPLSTILEHDTIERLAALLSQAPAEEPKPSSLVALNASGSRTPLYCIHPVGGSIVCYNAFPQALGAEWPVYAIQDKHLNGPMNYDMTERSFSSIKDMAHQYIAQIRAVQPTGPYALLGWSFGGIVAHEMACQLEQAGEEVEMLMLLDARLRSHDEAAFELSENEWKEYFLQDLTGVQMIGDRSDERKKDWSPDDEHLNHFYTLFKSNYRAMHEHVPQWFGGTLTWFKAQEEERALSMEGDWSNYAKQVDSIMLDGDHYSMMNPLNVARIAAYLKSYTHEAKESV
ncbi:amino acid adenylation domain-containing protein [Paenibacillus sp. QZ-Y1]|uniref:amino acid adenylation domain-containing protein n=1 Tax=Paenibacillus sp. QZ-Y1 TaxID=3414511 RepID=UPI003F799AE8